MDYKAPDAYRTISEVAEDLDLPQHVLRFWETRFTQIKPLKRGGGRRYYRPDDVDLLKGIRHLLYGEGYTIKGVQRILKEQGVASVLGVGRGTAGALAAIAGGEPRAATIVDDRSPHQIDPAYDRRESVAVPIEADYGAAPSGHWPPSPDPSAPGTDDLFPEEAGNEPGFDVDYRPAQGTAGMHPDALPHHATAPDQFDQRPGMDNGTPRVVLPPDAVAHRPIPPMVREGSKTSVAPAISAPVRPTAQTPRQSLAAPVRNANIDDEGEPLPAGVLPDDRSLKPSRFVGRMLGHEPARNVLTRDEVRRLQATLFELLECKRLLDQVR